MSPFAYQTLRCPRCGGTLYHCRCKREAEDMALGKIMPVLPVLPPIPVIKFVIPEARTVLAAPRGSAKSFLVDPVPVRLPLPQASPSWP